MVKKLLLKVFTFWALILTSFVGWGQDCPTSVSISVSPGTTICAGTEVTFTATPNGGTAPFTYVWKIDGVQSGTASTNNVFSSSSLANGQKISVTVTDGNGTSCSISSSAVTMTVNPLVTPTVSISANKTAICPGESITFNASNTYGGTSPQYSWFINNSSTASKTGESVSFSAADFPPGNDNTVRVVLTSNFDCTSPTTAEAASAQFTVREDATLSDPANDTQTVCINEAITPIQYAVGGGGTGATVTGLPSGVSGSFSAGTLTISGTPTTAGEFNYTVTTTGNCAQKTATGKITVNPNATIALTSGNNSQTVCAAGGVADGSINPITYSIGETGTGAVASGLPSGITGSYNNGNFTIQGSSSVVGTHSYSVKATGTCGESAPLTGSIVITANKSPSVSIISSETDNIICAGTSVTFTATPTNGGSNPVYQWKLDGSPVGTNSSKFTSTALTNGQTVTVDMSSSETCLTTATVTSTSIATTVNPNLIPAVTIEASDSDICPGDTVTFTATPTNGGTAPVYQWKIGTTNVGTNSPTFTTTELTDGKSVSVVLTSSETCLATTTATSNVLTTTVQPPKPATPGSITGPTEVCASGTGFTYSVAAVPDAESYNWTLPSGWAITAGAGTRSITVSASSTDGNINVSATNSCGTGGETNLAVVSVDGVPATPGAINAPNLPTSAICPPATGIEFNVSPVSGATGYKWTLPAGWEITSGSGTNSIVVKVNSTAETTADASISVEAINLCGNSSKSTLSGIAIDNHVITNAGADRTVCKTVTSINIEGFYSFSGTNKNLKPTWSVGTGMGAFADASKLTTTYMPSQAALDAGSVVLTLTTDAPSGACGPGKDEMTIFFLSNATISETSASYKDQAVCINSAINTIEFSIGGAVNGATVTGLPTSVTGAYSTGKFVISGTPTVAGTFNYTINTTGECTQTSTTGTIKVDPVTTVNAGQAETDIVCQSPTPSPITLTGATFGGGATSAAWYITSGGGTLSSTAQTSTPQNVTYTPALTVAAGCTVIVLVALTAEHLPGASVIKVKITSPV